MEDEIEVRRVVLRQLQSLGRHLIECGGADEALALLERTPEISALLSDIVMPGTNGIDLAEVTRARRGQER